MVAIINGTRVTRPKPNLNIPSHDPNNRLTVINNTIQITEKEKSETSDQKKIAGYKLDKLRQFSNTLSLSKALIRQRKGDKNEISGKIERKLGKIRQDNLSGTRFAKEVGKGSVFDTMG